MTLLGAVGVDEHAAVGLADLEEAGVDTSRVEHLDSAHTGTALIVVDAAGQNQIAVAPGVGATLRPATIRGHLDELLAGADCVLVSTEVAPAAVSAAVTAAAAAGVTCVLNTAPPYPEIVDLLSAGPILSPNQHELAILDALTAETPAEDPATAALRLVALTGAPVVVTLGADGALVARPDAEVVTVPAPVVDARDTTGAGDTFNGVLASRLAAGATLLEAVHIAVVAASLSVREAGARAGMPTTRALDDELTLTSAEPGSRGA